MTPEKTGLPLRGLLRGAPVKTTLVSEVLCFENGSGVVSIRLKIFRPVKKSCGEVWLPVASSLETHTAPVSPAPTPPRLRPNHVPEPSEALQHP